MSPRSLRLRLLGGSALGIALALLITGLSIGYLFVASVEQSLKADLGASLSRLMAVIDALPSTPLPDPRYERPFSGLYWQVEPLDGGPLLRSRSLWDFALAAPDFSDGAEHFLTLPGPAQTSVSALTRQVRLTGGATPKTYRVTVAEDRAILDATIARFGSQLAISLALLAAALIAAAWWQVELGLKPLNRVRAGIEAIRRGTAQRLPDTYPSELLPLVSEVNDLLRSRETSVSFARARAADLAHGIKTPLAVLETLSEQLRHRGDTQSAQILSELSTEMADRIDYQLRLSRLNLRTREHRMSAPLNQVLERTIAVLQKTRAGEALHWSLAADTLLFVDLDSQDLMELIGVLLENAAKWARSQVAITAAADAGRARIVIADDGPGLDPSEIVALGARGRRLDESGKGSGLGLAIALEITEINGGTLAMGRAETGGLAITLILPLAQV